MIRLVAALFLASLSLSACNTVAGAGEDLSSAGHAVTESADDVQDRT